MSSEYLTWLARNEKPVKPRELTPKERRANWWHYNKWYVVIAIAAAAVVCGFIWDIVRNVESEPDCQIGYVGSYYLPDDTVAALEANLAPLIGDLDGNGTAIIHINQYLIQQEDAETLYNDPTQQMLLMTHLTTGVNSMFLLEDPAAFHKKYGILSLEDGTEAPEESTEDLWYLWSDCEVLSSLPLGSFDELDITGDSQEILSALYIARTYLGNNPDKEAQQRYNTVWKKLISGADS